MFSPAVFLELVMISIICKWRFQLLTFSCAPYLSSVSAGMFFVLFLSWSMEIAILIYLGRSMSTLFWVMVGLGTKSLLGWTSAYSQGLRIDKARWFYVTGHNVGMTLFEDEKKNRIFLFNAFASLGSDSIISITSQFLPKTRCNIIYIFPHHN